MALAIGNDRYKSLPDLNNSHKYAEEITGKLKELCNGIIFETTVGCRTMGRSIGKVNGLLAGVEAGVVFYAGQGIQSGVENWLIPSSAEVETEGDL